MIKRLVRYKIYYDRARAYIGAVQFLMLAVILAKQFGFRLGLFGSLLLIVTFFAGCLVVGYIDTKLGIRAEEAHNYNEQNPEVSQTLRNTKEILTILQPEDNTTPYECSGCYHQNSENCNTCRVLNPQFDGC